MIYIPAILTEKCSLKICAEDLPRSKLACRIRRDTDSRKPVLSFHFRRFPTTDIVGSDVFRQSDIVGSELARSKLADFLVDERKRNHNNNSMNSSSTSSPDFDSQ